MARSRVAVLRVRPEHVLEDIDRLHELAGVETALKKGAQTILKDNISWHFPFPGANTTPWQLEGCVRSLRARGYDDVICVQNKTVVTDAFKGEDLNGYVPIFKRYEIPVRYNFKPEEMTWSVYRPKAKMNVLDTIFPEGIQIPDAFHGTNIVHLPTVKCVSGDTELMLGDGTVITIRDLVAQQQRRASSVDVDSEGTEHAKGDASVFAMAADGSVCALGATHFARSRRNGRKVLRMRTKTGRSLVATADHPLFSANGWKKLGELELGSRIAIARSMRVRGKAQSLPRTHAARPINAIVARGGRTYDAQFAQTMVDGYRSGVTVTALAVAHGVRWQKVQHVLKRHGVELRRNVVPIAVPASTSAAFWRWMGYFIAEGCAEDLEKGAGKIWWTNTDEALRSDFIALSRELFDVEARPRNAAQISIYSRDLVRFLGELGLEVPCNSGNKRVPRALMKCTDDEIAAFLAAYLDGDGTVSARQAEVSATTKSEGLARDLLLLFSRLGVVASIRIVRQQLDGWDAPRSYFQVVVSGAQVARLASALSLRHQEKARRLAMHAERLEGSKQPSNWDTVPLPGAELRRIRVGLGLTQQATGLASSVNNVEHEYTQPTPRIARLILSELSNADHDSRFADELTKLTAIANEDLAWDVIESLEEVDGDIDLFDITVPEAGSFIANGIVAHNCHIYTTTTGARQKSMPCTNMLAEP